MDKTDVITTMCNDGYIDFCLNWLHSVRNVGLEKYVVVFTIGDESYERMSTENVEVIRCEDIFELGDISRKFIEFRAEGWSDLVFMKLRCVLYLFNRGKNVLHSDSDIVFLKDDLLEIIKKKTEEVDCSFQLERNARADCVCSGFFYMKSNERTINLMDIETTKNICNFRGDQNLINTRIYIASNNSKTKRLASAYRNFIEGKHRHKFQFDARPLDIPFYLNQWGWSVKDSIGFDWNGLDMTMFPWGPKWKTMNQSDKSKARMVHYNGIIGKDNKIEAMKKYGHWCLEQ